MNRLRNALAGAAFVFCTSSMAHAQAHETTVASERMSEDMHAYFAGEKRGGIFFMTAGVTALVVGGVSFAQKTDFYRGFSYPVLLVGAIESVIGAGLYLRTDARVARLDRSLASEPAVFRRDERERIGGVNRAFGILEIAEVALALGGAGLGIVGGVRKNDSMKGIGLGLAIQSSAMLTLDLFAAKRGESYAASLRSFDPSPTSSRSTATLDAALVYRPAIAVPPTGISALLVDRTF